MLPGICGPAMLLDSQRLDTVCVCAGSGGQGLCARLFPPPSDPQFTAARNPEEAFLHTVPPICEPGVAALRTLQWIFHRQEACGRRADREGELVECKVYGRHLCASAKDFLLYPEVTIISEVGK